MPFEDVNLTRKDWEQIRREQLNLEIGQWFKDQDPKHGRYSEYARAADAISKAALRHAEVNNVPFESLLEQGLDVVGHLRYALHPFELKGEVDNDKELKLWSHRPHPQYDLKNDCVDVPNLNGPAEIEGAVGLYMALPYRVDYIDRLFVDLLIALELYRFGGDILHEIAMPELLIPPRSLFKQTSPLKVYIRGRAIEFLLFFASPGLIVFLLHWGRIISAEWAWGAYTVCAGFYLFSSLIAATYLPNAWRLRRKNIDQMNLLWSEFLKCYSALKSAGPISAHHVLELVKAAADKGVIWPGPLYALLDDIIARTGRF